MPLEVIGVIESRVERLAPDSEAAHWAARGVCVPRAMQDAPKEVITVYAVEASVLNWVFRRCWRYWECCASENKFSIPEEVAKELNETWGSYIRVEGFAGGRDVRGPVSNYHVDTRQGLDMLVATLLTATTRRLSLLHEE